jgi:hypothetical protein
MDMDSFSGVKLLARKRRLTLLADLPDANAGLEYAPCFLENAVVRSFVRKSHSVTKFLE